MAPEASRPMLASVIDKLEKRLVQLKKDVAISHITYYRARQNAERSWAATSPTTRA